MVLELTDISHLQEEALRAFDERKADNQQEAVATLEGELTQLYRMAVLLVRREPEVDRVAALWDFMVNTCDNFAAQASRLSPLPAAHDHILDIRNRCIELRDLHS